MSTALDNKTLFSPIKCDLCHTLHHPPKIKNIDSLSLRQLAKTNSSPLIEWNNICLSCYCKFMADSVNKTLELKWDPIKKGQIDSHKSLICYLCQVFNCDKCPITLFGFPGCDNTPYVLWIRHQQIEHREHYHKNQMIIRCKTCTEIAEKQIAFLKSVKEMFEGEYKKFLLERTLLN